MTQPHPHNAIITSFVNRHYDGMLTRGEEAYMGPPYVYMTGLAEGIVRLSTAADTRSSYEVSTVKLPPHATKAHDDFEARGFNPKTLESGIWVVKAVMRPASGLDTPAPPWQPVRQPLKTYAHYEAGNWHTATTSDIHGPISEDAPRAPMSEAMEAAIARIAQESEVFYDMAATFRTDASLYAGMRRMALARAHEDSSVQDHTAEMCMRALFATASEQRPGTAFLHRYAFAWPKPPIDYFTSCQFQGNEPTTPEEIVALSLDGGEASDATASTLPRPYPAYNANVFPRIFRQNTDFFPPDAEL